MGADGGTIARRTDMVRVKASASDADASSDPAQRLRMLWTLCRLSREPLVQPVVADQLGRMYNREAVLLHLAARAQQQRSEELDELAHVRRMADVTTLKLTLSPSASTSSAPESLSRSSTLTSAHTAFLCPLTQRAMNGRARFIYMGRCACVMSEQGLRATCSPASGAKRKAPQEEEASGSGSGSGSGSEQEGSAEKAKATDMQPCPLCATPFDASVLAKGEVIPTGDVVVINPSAEEEAPMRAAMEARRATEAKEKAERKSKNKKADAGGCEDEAEKQRRKEEKKARKAEAAAMLAAAVEEGPSAKRAKLEAPSVDARNAGAGAGSAAAAIVAKAKQDANGNKELSPALRSMYGLDLDKRKKVGSDWMVRGTFGRFA